MTQLLTAKQLWQMTINALITHASDCCIEEIKTSNVEAKRKWRQQAELSFNVVHQKQSRSVEAYA